MKIKDIAFSGKNAAHVKACVFNPVAVDENYKKRLYEIVQESETVNDFIKKYLNCDELKKYQAYAELSRNYSDEGRHWYRIREMLGERVFKTEADAGGVKIGTPEFSVIINNGRGDGITRVAVVDRDSWNSSFLDFETVIRGSQINIYDYDCGDGNNVAITLSGRYGVYTGYGFVVFEKWD